MTARCVAMAVTVAVAVVVVMVHIDVEFEDINVTGIRQQKLKAALEAQRTGAVRCFYPLNVVDSHPEAL